MIEGNAQPTRGKNMPKRTDIKKHPSNWFRSVIRTGAAESDYAGKTQSVAALKEEGYRVDPD